MTDSQKCSEVLNNFLSAIAAHISVERLLVTGKHRDRYDSEQYRNAEELKAHVETVVFWANRILNARERTKEGNL